MEAVWSMSGLLSLSTADKLSRIILCCGGCPVLCRMCIEWHPCPPPLEAGSTLSPQLVTSKRVSFRKHFSRKKKCSQLFWLCSQILWDSEWNWGILQSGLVVSQDPRSDHNVQSPGEHARWLLGHWLLQPGVLCLERMGRPLWSSFIVQPLCPGALGFWLYSQNWAQIHVTWERCLCVCVYVRVFLFYHFLKASKQTIHTHYYKDLIIQREHIFIVSEKPPPSCSFTLGWHSVITSLWFFWILYHVFT